MKRIVIYGLILLASVASLLAGCNDDIVPEITDEQQPVVETPKGKPIPFSVTASSADSEGTKVTLGSGNSQVFQSGDKLYLSNAGGTFYGTLDLKSGATTTSAVFEGILYDNTGLESLVGITLNATLYGESDLLQAAGSYSGAIVADLATAVEKYSNLTGTLTYGSGSVLSLSQNSSFLDFTVTLTVSPVPADGTPCSVTIFGNDGTIDGGLVLASGTATAQGGVLSFAVALPAGAIVHPEIQVEGMRSTFGPATLTLAKNTQYQVACTMSEKNIPLTVKTTGATALDFTNYLGTSLQYSVDGGPRQSLGASNTIEATAGQVIQLFDDFKGEHGKILLDDKCLLYGNVMSLVSSTDYYKGTLLGKGLSARVFKNLFWECKFQNDAFNDISLPATKLGQECYMYMFNKCTGMTRAPKLPAKEAEVYCYEFMFNGCTGLTTPPDLPATKLSVSCYAAMFQGCSNLTCTPELPAKVMAHSCYWCMFSGCTSLTQVPDLPAESLHISCYQNMFSGCTGLTAISADLLPLTALRDNCYDGMFAGCTNITSIPETSAQHFLPANVMVKDCYASMFAGTGITSIPSTLLHSTSLAEGCYQGMFAGCSALTAIPASLLPAEYMEKSCYQRMFADCTALESVPTGLLHSSNLAESCFEEMFYECSELLTVPSDLLPATVMQKSCYKGMFSRCYALTKTPALPIETVAEACCKEMFFYCEDLTEVPVTLASMTMADDCYMDMFMYCFSLTTAPELPATTVAPRCYFRMFDGDSLLVQAPSELPATSLEKQCYYAMFSGCKVLTTAPNLLATTLADQCYQQMFYDCWELVSVPASIPASTPGSMSVSPMAVRSCYWMFGNCKKLAAAPALPATTLAKECYANMFSDCAALTTPPPELPAMTLAESCYSGMFSECRALSSAPALRAPTLVSNCYSRMFYHCPSLPSVTCLATDISAANCTYDWLNYVAHPGTFYKASGMTDWTTGTSGIPSGWSVVEL